MNILLGVTGSVAAKLTPKMIDALLDKEHDIRIIYTKSSLHFTYKSLYFGYDDEDEWKYYDSDNVVLHIELVKWADRFIIAPCTANTLAKIANGICDNLLTSCVRAWDWEKKIIVAPAMNTEMYKKSITELHRRILFSLGNGFVWVPPQSKLLFCGDEGIGAMAQIDDIVKYIK